MEQISNRFTFPNLENYVNQFSVVFGVSERDLDK